MFGLGVPELMIILVLGVVLFGSSRLPQLGSGLGKAIRDFKKGVAGIEDEIADKESRKDESKRPAPVRAKMD
jgi:sec-independent protein translocase protein TatA